MKQMIREAILQRLSELKLTQKKLADDVGVTYQNLNSFLKGRREFPLSDIERILAYLKLDIKSCD